MDYQICPPSRMLCVSRFWFRLTDTDRRFLTARRFDPDGALEQFKEASDFRQEKDVLRLYDVVEIADFEQARQFVSCGLACPLDRSTLTGHSVPPLDGSPRQKGHSHFQV